MSQAPTIIAPFKPYPWQVEPWRDKSPVLLLTGSAGGGKSRLAAEKLHGYLKKYPGAMGLVLRKMRESLTNSVLPFLEEMVIGDDPDVTHIISRRRFEYANGSMLAYGGMKDQQQQEQIRSIGVRGGLDIVWMEEANAFTETDFNEILARMRGTAGNFRQIILTTNPDAPTHWIHKRLMKGEEASVYYSHARDNPANPPSYLTALQTLTGVLYDRLVLGLWRKAQAEGALWNRELLEECRVSLHPDLVRVVVAIDPAMTATTDSNETGIIVAGIDGNREGYVINDLTCKGSPGQWASAAVGAYEDYAASRIVAEVNNGGDMVEHTIRMIDRSVSYKSVHASRGKRTRAEPIAALYERGLVHHVGHFRELEDQMCLWIPGEDSPDRMDALVWALSDLMLKQRKPPVQKPFLR